MTLFTRVYLVRFGGKPCIWSVLHLFTSFRSVKEKLGDQIGNLFDNLSSYTLVMWGFHKWQLISICRMQIELYNPSYPIFNPSQLKGLSNCLHTLFATSGVENLGLNAVNLCLDLSFGHVITFVKLDVQLISPQHPFLHRIKWKQCCNWALAMRWSWRNEVDEGCYVSNRYLVKLVQLVILWVRELILFSIERIDDKNNFANGAWDVYGELNSEASGAKLDG